MRGVVRPKRSPAMLACFATTLLVASSQGCGWSYMCTAKGCGKSGLHVDITTKDAGPLTGDSYSVEVQSTDARIDDICDIDTSAPKGCSFGDFSEQSVSVSMDGNPPISVSLPNGPAELRVLVHRDGAVVLDETLTPKYQTSILDNGDAPECKSTCRWADPITLTMTD